MSYAHGLVSLRSHGIRVKIVHVNLRLAHTLNRGSVMAGITAFKNENWKHSVRTTLIAALFLIVLMKTLSAAEVQLRCGEILLSVNQSINTVSMVYNSETTVFVDNDNVDYTNPPNPPRTSPPCHFTGKVYVRIDPHKIAFGSIATNDNFCYIDYIPMTYQPNQRKVQDAFIIDRITGKADLNGRKSECEKYTGPKF